MLSLLWIQLHHPVLRKAPCPPRQVLRGQRDADTSNWLQWPRSFIFCGADVWLGALALRALTLKTVTEGTGNDICAASGLLPPELAQGWDDAST